MNGEQLNSLDTLAAELRESGLGQLLRERSVAFDKLDFGPGVTLTVTCGACPVQFEGTVDEQPAYFRARGDGWSFTIVDDDEDPVGPDDPNKVRYHATDNVEGGMFAASWLDPLEAGEIITRCIKDFRSGGSGVDKRADLYSIEDYITTGKDAEDGLGN